MSYAVRTGPGACAHCQIPATPWGASTDTPGVARRDPCPLLPARFDGEPVAMPSRLHPNGIGRPWRRGGTQISLSSSRSNLVSIPSSPNRLSSSIRYGAAALAASAALLAAGCGSSGVQHHRNASQRTFASPHSVQQVEQHFDAATGQALADSPNAAWHTLSLPVEQHAGLQPLRRVHDRHPAQPE